MFSLKYVLKHILEDTLTWNDRLNKNIRISRISKTICHDQIFSKVKYLISTQSIMFSFITLLSKYV